MSEACEESSIGDHQNCHNTLPNFRDIFLSHRSVDNEFVWRLSRDIELNSYQNRTLLTWVDEAEIKSGLSVVGIINRGLEMSRFIGFVMTPDYFTSESGWTDAEWHAAISNDPDNRRGRIIPLLVKDCPYVPFLLRHLKAVDMRGNRFKKGLSELIMILRDKPLIRPSVYRGQLITTSGMITRESLFVERSVPEGDPDLTRESLHCNLIPVERLPQNICTAKISEQLFTDRYGAQKLPTKNDIKNRIREAQEQSQIDVFVPAFRLLGDRIVTFHDLEDPEGPFGTVVESQSIRYEPLSNWILDEDDRRVLISLLNMGISRHLMSVGLVHDPEKQGRFFFPPKEGYKNVVEWIPFKNKVTREVAGPRFDSEGNILFWRHLAAYIKLFFISSNFFLQVRPTWMFTEDGFKIKRGSGLSRLVNRWTNPERNIHVMYHVRFWTSILRRKRSGPISIRVGDHFMELANRPALINMQFGISDDQKNLMHFLDEEMPFIQEAEEELNELAADEITLEEIPSDENEEADDEMLIVGEETED